MLLFRKLSNPTVVDIISLILLVQPKTWWHQQVFFCSKSFRHFLCGYYDAHVRLIECLVTTSQEVTLLSRGHSFLHYWYWMIDYFMLTEVQRQWRTCNQCLRVNSLFMRSTTETLIFSIDDVKYFEFFRSCRRKHNNNQLVCLTLSLHSDAESRWCFTPDLLMNW